MEWCVISALMFLVQMPIISLVTFTHTLNTHSFTHIHAFAQHFRVHNAARIDLVQGPGLSQTHDLDCLFWSTTVTLHTGTLMDKSCWEVLCTVTHKCLRTYTSAQAHTKTLKVNGFCGCFSSSANIKDSLSPK